MWQGGMDGGRRGGREGGKDGAYKGTLTDRIWESGVAPPRYLRPGYYIQGFQVYHNSLEPGISGARVHPGSGNTRGPGYSRDPGVPEASEVYWQREGAVQGTSGSTV